MPFGDDFPRDGGSPGPHWGNLLFTGFAGYQAGKAIRGLVDPPAIPPDLNQTIPGYYQDQYGMYHPIDPTTPPPLYFVPISRRQNIIGWAKCIALWAVLLGVGWWIFFSGWGS